MILKVNPFMVIMCYLLPLPILAQQSSKSADTILNGNIKAYNEIITKDAISSSGLLIVHKVAERYFFEIPDSILNREILIVNRIAKSAADNRSQLFGYANDEISENVILFTKQLPDKIFVKKISYSERSDDSSANGMYYSLMNSSQQPIVQVFNIKAISSNGKGYVIDITDYINGDNGILGFESSGLIKKSLLLGAIQADKSYIEKIQTFPFNVEIQTVKTYASSSVVTPFFTYTLNSSLVLLPVNKMRPRMSDERVGYFISSFRDYDQSSQAVNLTRLIKRWRVEPNAEDIDKYLRGELVIPAKPIIFYIDPATPKKWVPYLIQGVKDWQKAFEKAGFKNAIYAREAPTKQEDSTWSLEDARFSAIVYKSSPIKNAYGPSIVDPRTGEILESHVGWFHNIMQLLHDWYFVQAANIDARAIDKELPDSLMGRLIRYVCSHEIGHTLGLTHNFRASYSVAVDSLRNNSWLSKNGLSPSIMDYARFNYVAQPEDSISEGGIIPIIGAYDVWAIQWGYKWFPSSNSLNEEKEISAKWITTRLEQDKRLWYEDEKTERDPRNQAEDLGNDAIKAGLYGIKNLQRIMLHLVDWSKEPGKNYERLDYQYNLVVNQYKLYLQHVIKYIGGTLYNPITSDQHEKAFEFLEKSRQQAAVKFLGDQLFTTPTWLFNEKLYELRGGGASYELLLLQHNVLKILFDQSLFSALQRFEAHQSQKKAYTTIEYLTDLKMSIWAELRIPKTIDFCRRNLQKEYVNNLIGLLLLMNERDNPNIVILNTDFISVVKGHIKSLIKDIDIALPQCPDEITKLHLVDVKERLTDAMQKRFQNK